jgi:hypothetical protein
MSDASITSPAERSTDSDIAQRDRDICFEQYKLAVEMAAQVSNKRHDANRFYIGLVSALGVLYKFLDKLAPSPDISLILPVLGLSWSVLWLSTIRAYRRINIAKWTAIYELEAQLPGKPFTAERDKLREVAEKGHKAIATRSQTGEDQSPGSFGLTKVELAIPLVVGFIFFFLAVLQLLGLYRKR